MLPSDTTRLARMRACRSDLLANDIPLDEADHQGLGELSRRHLHYFQLMLGYDATPGELVSLAKRIRPRAVGRSIRLAVRRGVARARQV